MRGCAVAIGWAAATGLAANAAADNTTVIIAANTTVVAAGNSTGNTSASGNLTATTGSATMDAQYDLMVRFITMPPEHLAEVRKLIDRLDDMSPEDKAALQQRVLQQVAVLKALYDALGPAPRQFSLRDRDVLRRYYLSLNPEDTQAWVERAKTAKSPTEGRAIVSDMLTSAAARGITPNMDLSDKVPQNGSPPGGGGDRDRGGPGGGGRFSPYGPNGGIGVPPPRGEHKPAEQPAPPPSNTTASPAPASGGN
jgi:hypothetical protein